MDRSTGEPEDMVLTTSTNAKMKEKDSSNLSLISRCSSTDSEPGGQEPGCSTHLLESDNYQPFIIHLPYGRQSVSADTDSNYSLRTRKSSLTSCPLDVLFFHWNWAGMRLGCFVVFICVLVGMFCVVLRSVTSQTSQCVPSREWWQGTVSYEIFPASFQDSDGDGYGDFAGLRWRLGYVQKQSVASIRLNSIFSALDYPLEYTHVIDFKNVDPHLGRISDFEELVQDIHARGLHVILDINPTLTSDQHPWAAHWQQNKSGEYQHFYVEVNKSRGKFVDTHENLADEKENPNRPFGGQLFLNWSHPEVQRKMNSALEFWLQKGVDGFYIKNLELLQVELERDLYIVMKHWRILLDKYSSDTKKNILLVPFPFLQTLKEKRSRFLRSLLNFCDIIDFQLNFNLSNPMDLKVQLNVADEWSALSPSTWINWHLGSAETTRLSTRLDGNYTLSTMLLLLVLPGSISLFYGDEISLRDSLDIFTGKGYREGQLCPMQWTFSTESNFTKNGTLPWLPINPEFSSQNVENKSAEISLISQLIALRNKSPSLWMKAIYDGKSAICDGRPFTYVLHPDEGCVIILERYFPTKERYVVGVNFERKPVSIDFTEFVSEAHILFSTNKEIGEKYFKDWKVENVSLNLGDVFIAETND